MSKSKQNKSPEGDENKTTEKVFLGLSVYYTCFMMVKRLNKKKNKTRG